MRQSPGREMLFTIEAVVSRDIGFRDFSVVVALLFEVFFVTMGAGVDPTSFF